jgi:DNA ligase-1
MADLQDGETFLMSGSAAKPYELKNVGGVYSCTCPAWRNQSLGIEKRTCKHLRKFRGDAQEDLRIGNAVSRSSQLQPTNTGTNTSTSSGSNKAGPPLLLAHNWDHTEDLVGWWMSEKLDGVRAYWDGKQFISRLGNPYLAPDWFMVGLPNTPLDGELWGGRKNFQRTISIVRRQDKSDDWKQIRYLVFDAPSMNAPFEERMDALRKQLDKTRPPYAQAHPHDLCKGLDHLKKELARVEALGGEGLMLRQPKSRYQVGRSTTLLKVKSFFDAEAKVIGHVPGEGKHKGRLGALEVEMPNGTRFNVGTGFSDAERKAPPPIGSIITYRYQELSNAGVPRFPSFIAIREDLPWPPPSQPPQPASTPKASSSPAPKSVPAPTPTPAPAPAPRMPLIPAVKPKVVGPPRAKGAKSK